MSKTNDSSLRSSSVSQGEAGKAKRNEKSIVMPCLQKAICLRGRVDTVTHSCWLEGSKGYVAYIPLPHLIKNVTVKQGEFLLAWIRPDSHHHTIPPNKHTHTSCKQLVQDLTSKKNIKNDPALKQHNLQSSHLHIVCNGKRAETR